MISRGTSTVLVFAAMLGATVACSASDDDDCPGCEPSRGGITFPPPVPTVGGPEPTGGATATGGFSGDTSGGFGGTTLGGTGGVGAFGAQGGSAGVGAFGAQGGTSGVGAFGAQGGTSGTGAFGAEGGTLAGGVFGTGGIGGTF